MHTRQRAQPTGTNRPTRTHPTQPPPTTRGNNPNTGQPHTRGQPQPRGDPHNQGRPREQEGGEDKKATRTRRTNRVHYAAQNQPTHPPTHTVGGTRPNTRTTPHHRPGGHSGAGKRPDPYRTRKLSPPAPMVLPPPGSGRVGHHRNTHTPTGPHQGPTTMGRPPQHPRCGGRTHHHNNPPTPHRSSHTTPHTTTVDRPGFCGGLVMPWRVQRRWWCGCDGSGARRRTPRSVRSPGNRRARHLTRENVPLADVLAG